MTLQINNTQLPDDDPGTVTAAGRSECREAGMICPGAVLLAISPSIHACCSAENSGGSVPPPAVVVVEPLDDGGVVEAVDMLERGESATNRV